jgi:hypothetical protein
MSEKHDVQPASLAPALPAADNQAPAPDLEPRTDFYCGCNSECPAGHKRVRLAHEDWEEFVDEELFPLLRLLWNVDIMTFRCCQEDAPGIVWLQFMTAADAAAFLELATEDPAGQDLSPANDAPAAGATPFAGTLNERMVGCGREGNWQYDIQPWDRAWRVDMLDDGVLLSPGETQFDFYTSVRFPRSDLPLVLDLVSRAVHDPGRMKYFGVRPGDWRTGTAEHNPFPDLLLSLLEASVDEACAVDLSGQAGVQVEFSSVYDLQMFLDLTVGYAAEQDHPPGGGRDEASPGPLRGEAVDAHILGCGCGSAWRYAGGAVDLSIEEEVVNGQVRRRRIDWPMFDFRAAVRFPRRDLPAINQRLSRAAWDWDR